MKKTVIFALAASAAFLTACSDDKPGNSVFEKTINSYSEKQGVCLPLLLNIQNPNAPDSFAQIPVGTAEIRLAEKDRNGGSINQTAAKQLDLLVREDFYEKSKETAPAAPGSRENTKLSVYRLTEAGGRQTRSSGHMPYFCIGRQKVGKINWYTEPAPSGGMTVSRVSYDTRFVPEKWLDKLLKAGGDGSRLPVEETRTETATLVKTGDGWKDIRELR